MRNKRQKEWADKWLKSQWGILYLCPRSGKCKTTINILNSFNNTKILIIHPLETIRKVWQDEFIKWGYETSNVEYSTTQSLWKLSEKPDFYDIIIIDEIHQLSPANLVELQKLIDFGNKKVLGLSGTISEKTEEELLQTLNLPILAHYPIEQAIKEGVITDYEIKVIKTKLDNTVKYIQPSKKRKFFITEKQRYDWLTNKIEEYKIADKDLGLLPIQRMQVFKKSIAKLEVTKLLINRFKDERVLVFCGTTSIADSLGVPVYHSKDKDEDIKDAFCKGIGNVLATVDMFEAGVTIKPINRAIINSFDSNPENLAQRISRLTGFEYDNPEKIAKVYIVCTDTDVEERWLRKALEFFDPSKIKYIQL